MKVEWIACIYEGPCILLPCSTIDGDFLGTTFRRLAAAAALVNSDLFSDRIVVDVLFFDVDSNKTWCFSFPTFLEHSFDQAFLAF